MDEARAELSEYLCFEHGYCHLSIIRCMGCMGCIADYLLGEVSIHGWPSIRSLGNIQQSRPCLGPQSDSDLIYPC